MGAKQKYLEVSFDIEMEALVKINEMEVLGYNISVALYDNLTKLKDKNSVVQTYGVMVNDEFGEDTPFALKLIKQKEEDAILVDLYEISIDTYLDLLQSNKSLTHAKG